MVKPEIKDFKFYSDGKLIAAGGEKTFPCVNPSLGEVFARAPDADMDDMVFAICAARISFDEGVWTSKDIRERGSFLIKIAELIRENAKVLAELETLSTGKTSKHTTFIDVPTCADTFEYFGSDVVLEQMQGHANPVTAPVKSRTEFEPMGVVGCIIPWNYPLIMTAWKIAPALIAGNSVILKPSSKGCVSILKLAELIQEVGLPKGVLNIITTSQHDIAEELIRSEKVDMISFTGGTETGQDVMRICSEAPKKVSLELGGKSPNLVFADCDMEAAVGGTLSSIFMNQGQMCTASSRLLLEESIADEFLKLLGERTRNIKIGLANSYETDFGPLISKEHRDHVLMMIQQGIEEGAQVLCGGKIPEAPELQYGYFLEPTILTNVNNQMDVARDEIFGPVLVVMTFKDEAQALELANDSAYGLASCVWTKDLDRAGRVAKKLQCGTVWVNTYGGFYNEASYGGYKRSGFGRELGLEGLLAYTQSKNICIDATPGGKSLVTSWF